jgi:hypothetical protein
MFIGKAGAFLSAVPRWSHGENEEQRFGGVGERGAVQCRHSFLQRTASPLHVHMIWAVGVGEELLLALLLFVSLHAPRFPCLPLMHCQHVVFPGLAALDIPSTFRKQIRNISLTPPFTYKVVHVYVTFIQTEIPPRRRSPPRVTRGQP